MARPKMNVGAPTDDAALVEGSDVAATAEAAQATLADGCTALRSISDLIAQAATIAQSPQEAAALHALTASLTDFKRRADTVAEHLSGDDYASLMDHIKAL